MAPLLIDSLVTATSTFCEFFCFTCIKLLTVISRGPILRIQIRGTSTPQNEPYQERYGAFGVGRSQAGFKAKKPTRSPAPRRIGTRYLHNGWCQLISRMAEHLPFTSVIPEAVHRTRNCLLHQIVAHQIPSVPRQE